MIKFKKNLFLFCAGGLGYNLLEIVWRGSSHWTMFLVGGSCFRVIGSIRRHFPKLRLIPQCALCSASITLIEFLSGCLINKKLGLQVWDYSHLPLNIFGQVCLPFSLLWGGVSILALKADTLLCRFLDIPPIEHRHSI